MKTTITEILIKLTLEGISSRLGIRRRHKWYGRYYTENHPMRIAKKRNKLKSKKSLRDLWNNVKYMNIHIGLPEGEEGEEGGQKMYLIKWQLKTSQARRRKQAIGSTQAPKQDEPKYNHTKRWCDCDDLITIKMAEVDDKDRIRKCHVRGNSHKAMNWLFCISFTG